MAEVEKVARERATAIVAENIDAWKWGPLEEIEGLSEHTLAVNAAAAGYRAGIVAGLVEAKGIAENNDHWPQEGANIAAAIQDRIDEG